MSSEVIEFLKEYRDLYNFSGPGLHAMAPPIFHNEAVDQLVSEALENADRAAGPMQHMVIVGGPGTGKTFLTFAFTSMLGMTTFPGKVVRMPQYQPHIQSPEDFINEVYTQLKGDRVRSTGTWEETTAKIDKQFSASSRKQRLMILIAEDFPGLIRRAFGSHGAQAKLRNWLDRSESRVMLVTTSDFGGVDSEPGDPLFGIFNSITLGEIALTEARSLFASGLSHPKKEMEDRLLRFLFLLTDRTPKAVNVLARAYAQNAKQGLRFVIADYQRYYATFYERTLAGLGQRAAICMHFMITGGEPVSQSDLVHRLGGQKQSVVAQPFSEMRRKHLLREEAAPSGRAKLVSFADRFFVSFYRQSALGVDERHDLVVLLAEALGSSATDDIRKNVDALAIAVKNDGRATAFKKFTGYCTENTKQDKTFWRVLAVRLIEVITASDPLRDFGEELSKHDELSARIVSAYAECVEVDDPSRWALSDPDLRALFEALGLTA